MSAPKEVKKIDLKTLDVAESKVSSGKARKAIVAALVLVLIAGAGYAAYRVVAGEVVASRFTVTQMNCPACVITVKEISGKIPGVVETEVSLAGQDAVVKYRNNKTSPDQIREAMARGGYPAIVDGTFRPSGEGISDPVIATVNGRPLFSKDLKTPMNIADAAAKEPAAAAAIFSTVGKELLLQAADTKTVVVQPAEIDEEVLKIVKEKGASPDEFVAKMTARFGSKEKYVQTVAQRMGIRRLLDEHVLQGVTDPQERQRKTMEWVGNLFKDADVRIVDQTMKEKIRSTAGQDDWKTFWPRMLAGDTDLKSLLLQ
jgi:copper chaperone CopZ